MSKSARSRFPLLFSAGFSLLFLLAYWPGLLNHLEDLWQDRLFAEHYQALKPGDARIIIAAMDDDTVHKFGFPLPRSVHAELLDKLKSYGVKTVDFDIMFLDPSPRDAEFVAANRRFGRVVNLFTIDGDKVQAPVPALAKASQFLGYPNVDQTLDIDGHLRRHILFDTRAVNPVSPAQSAPSMDIAGYASFTGIPLEKLAARFGGANPPVVTLNFRLPHQQLLHAARDAGKKDAVSFYSPYETISYMDLLSGDLTPDQRAHLKGAIVIAGSTAIGYFDHYPTPFVSLAPGSEFHCNIIDNLLHDDFVRLLPPIVTVAAILALIWLPFALLGLTPALAAAATAAAAAGWYGFCLWQFEHGARAEFVAPTLALTISFGVQTVHRLFTEGQEKRFIKGLFGQFVAPEVVEQLAKNPEKAKLGGEKRNMSVFFLDIAHFTTISEKLSAEDLIRFLNHYLSPLSVVIQTEKGVVDKYIGDCIMAFWNAPLPVEDHRTRACLAAIACQEAMPKLTAQLDGQIKLPETPAVRIGVNSGDMTVGLTGSERKFAYTVIGDEVNLASRLEGANKFFGSKIMASEDVYQGAKDAVEARELGRVRVVGKELPVRVYELLTRKGALSPEWQTALPHYNRGIDLFVKRQYAEAVAAFEEVVKIFPKDGPANLYLNQSRDYAAIPPEDTWDGVFNLTAK